MKGGAKKKSAEGGRDASSSLSMRNGDCEESSHGHIHSQNLQFRRYEEGDEEESEQQEEEEGEEEREEVRERELGGSGREEEEEEEKSKLDEGFYEIEAVRRKRIRKGQLQYLIKWRGWPETANTWEPLENLQSCSDVIDAFEESLTSGKHSRKRKRKSSATLTLPKKKQQQHHHSTSASYNVTGADFNSDETPPSASLNNFGLADPLVAPQSVSSFRVGEFDGDGIAHETTRPLNVNGGFANVSKKIYGRREGNEYDPKLSELKGAVLTNEAAEDKLATHFQETKISDGSCPNKRLTQVDCVEPALNNRRTGAKRRKSSSVKRFKQDLALCATNITFDSGGSLEQLRNEKHAIAGDDSNHKNTSGVIQIIQPISYSASIANNVQDVSVIFKAMRSDGQEVMVDNKFLKANNPLLLINFYEQHLKYNPIP